MNEVYAKYFPVAVPGRFDRAGRRAAEKRTGRDELVAAL